MTLKFASLNFGVIKSRIVSQFPQSAHVKVFAFFGMLGYTARRKMSAIPSLRASPRAFGMVVEPQEKLEPL